MANLDFSPAFATLKKDFVCVLVCLAVMQPTNNGYKDGLMSFFVPFIKKKKPFYDPH